MSVQLDPYGEFGSAPDDLSWMSDAEKLRLLADWFDLQDQLRGVANETDMQDDLRRMAYEMEHLDRSDDTVFWLLVGVVFFLLAVLLVGL